MLRSTRRPGVEYSLPELFSRASSKGQTAVIIGRGEAATLNIVTTSGEPPNAGLVLSRQHARLEVRERRLWIQDTGTVNKTYVNNVDIGTEWKKLRENDTISFGGPTDYRSNGVEVRNPWTYQVKGLAEFLGSSGSRAINSAPRRNHLAAEAATQEAAVDQSQTARLVQLNHIGLAMPRRHSVEGAQASAPTAAVEGSTAEQRRNRASREEQPQAREQFRSPLIRRPSSAPAPRSARKPQAEVIDLTGDSDDDDREVIAIPTASNNAAADIEKHRKRRSAERSTSHAVAATKRGKTTLETKPAKGEATGSRAVAGTSKAAPSSSPHADRVEAFSREFACAICQETIVMCYAMVPCGHNFCAECLAGWLVNKKDCPTCREKATAPPIRLNAIDNAINALETQLPKDEQEVRKEKKASWEVNRKTIEENLKAPWSKRQAGRSRAADNAHPFPVHPGLYGLNGMIGNMAAMLGGHYAMPSSPPGMHGGWHQEPPPERVQRRVHRPRVVDRHGHNEGVAAAAAVAAHQRAARAAAMNAAPVTAVPITRKEYTVRYMSPMSAAACPTCLLHSDPGELRIGMRTQPSNPSERSEAANPFSWFHIGCLPASLWREVRTNGVKDLRLLSVADQSRVRERMRAH